MVVWVIPRFCTQGHLYKSDIYHKSLLMTFFRSQSYAIDMTWFNLTVRYFRKVMTFFPYSSAGKCHNSYLCHYLPFLKKSEILKFRQIFGKNDTFSEIRCYDIFYGFYYKNKISSLSFLLPLISGIVSFSNSSRSGAEGVACVRVFPPQGT